MKETLIVLVVIILLMIFLYNRLIVLKNRVKNAWSGIDNQLKRRNDLIPNLVEVVKGYSEYEQETLQKVISARNKAAASKSIKDTAVASKELSGALSKLFMLSEAYPDLKANKSFEHLQIELVGTEDKIAYARQFYNNSVQSFNDKVQVFPNSILAKIFKFKKLDYFQVTDAEKQLVEVDFN